MFPKMFKIRQKFDSNRIRDIIGTINAELDSLELSIKKGSRIAITAGSRGIDSIPLIIKTVVQKVKTLGGEPFIIPAMGSHGGGTAEGQVNILKELGITSEAVGAPILSSMDVIEIGRIKVPAPKSETQSYVPVVMDKNTYESDGVIVVNRVKPHTSFHGEIESGMVKMMVIGLGKKAQAERLHSFGTKGLREYLIPMGREILRTGKVIAGIGIVENAYDKVMTVKAFLPSGIEEGEKELLKKARSSMPRLPVDNIDVLIVEQIGKNVSGTGMDTNVIGRLKIHGEAEPEKPSIKRIVVLGLTSETKGNAYGIGLADFTTKQLVENIDYNAMYTNAVTSTFTERVKIPVVAKDEDEAIGMALQTCGVKEWENARVVRIKNTLELEEVWVSKCIYEELKDSGSIPV